MIGFLAKSEVDFFMANGLNNYMCPPLSILMYNEGDCVTREIANRIYNPPTYGIDNGTPVQTRPRELWQENPQSNDILHVALHSLTRLMLCFKFGHMSISIPVYVPKITTVTDVGKLEPHWLPSRS